MQLYSNFRILLIIVIHSWFSFLFFRHQFRSSLGPFKPLKLNEISAHALPTPHIVRANISCHHSTHIVHRTLNAFKIVFACWFKEEKEEEVKMTTESMESKRKRISIFYIVLCLLEAIRLMQNYLFRDFRLHSIYLVQHCLSIVWCAAFPEHLANRFRLILSRSHFASYCFSS